MSSEAERRRDEAIERVARHADEDWKPVARRAGVYVCGRRVLLTSEDVREAVEEHYPQVETHEQKAYGPVMRWLGDNGFAEPTDKFVPYRRPSRHCGNSRVWRSLIYSNGDES